MNCAWAVAADIICSLQGSYIFWYGCNDGFFSAYEIFHCPLEKFLNRKYKNWVDFLDILVYFNPKHLFRNT